MKIVSWNCSGKFREKFQDIITLEADIYVIQECENPKQSNCINYKQFASNFLWVGENKNKGLGVFAKDEIKLKENDWQKFCLRNFLSVKVNNCFDLVAVWACNPYIEEYYVYQNINISNYNKNTIIIGDFNSNAIWDKKHGSRTHSTVVHQLNEIGILSVYHYLNNEKQGEESKPTFYMYRHPDKSYHIDHCYTSLRNIKDYHIMCDTNWLKKSDHMPILFETK